MERAGLHHSLHGRPYVPRERQNERERDGARRREEARHHTDRMNDTSYDCLGRSCSLWLLFRTLQLSSISQALAHWFITFNKTAIDLMWSFLQSFQTLSPGEYSMKASFYLFIFIFCFHCFIFIHRYTATELVSRLSSGLFKLQYEIFLPDTTHWKSQ